jgi:hypothetical protein
LAIATSTWSSAFEYFTVSMILHRYDWVALCMVAAMC